MYCLLKSQLVKLNNPLMGTETHRQIEHLSPCLNLRVKLNNPLMGTETWIYGFVVGLNFEPVLN